MLRSFSLWIFILAIHAVDSWQAQSTAQAAAGTGQLLEALDSPNLQLEMSGAHWNPLTKTLWVTAGGAEGKGTWALKYDSGSDLFSVLEYWTGPRDEDITQVSFAEVGTNQHRMYILREGADGQPPQIIQAKMTINTVGNGNSTIEHTWTITDPIGHRLNTSGTDGAEGLTFVPDEWLIANGFVDENGAAYTSTGGLGGLMFIAHQNGGYLFAVDLSADGSNIFSNNTQNYKVVGAYKTGAGESSALCFDRSIGRLYISHGSNTFNSSHRIEVTDLTSRVLIGDATATRQMNQRALFTSPALLSPEGFACTPFLKDDGTVNSEQWAFFANDCEIGDLLADKIQSVVWYKTFKPEEASPHEELEHYKGNRQSALISTAVAVAPAITVVDGRGYPVVGRAVTFTAHSGSSVTGGITTTDGLGHATCSAWILGSTAGSQSMTVTVSGVSGSVTFIATAMLNALSISAGNGQNAEVNTAVAVNPIVTLVNVSLAPLVGATVIFTASSGGSLATTSATTDALGHATCGTWTLGSTEGVQTINVTAIGASTITISATATAAALPSTSSTASSSDSGGGKCGSGAAFATLISLCGCMCLRRRERVY